MLATLVSRLLAVGVVGAVTFGALLQRRPGLQPVSLWLDDQWVAVLATAAPISLVLTGDFPCPPGFVLLLRTVVTFIGAGEFQLQLIPFVAGLATIPLLAWATTRATGNFALGIVAAVLIAGNETLAVYGLRVKPFTVDAFATTLLLALAVRVVVNPQPRTFAALAATATVMPLFSFPSLLIGGVLVNLIGIATLRQHKDFIRPALSRLIRNPIVRWIIVYNLAALVIYLLTMHGRGNPALHNGWTSFYLPLGDLPALQAFLAKNVTDLFTHAFPAAFPWLVLACPVGLAVMIIDRRMRILGLAVATVYGAFFVVSALGLYPIGEQRTEAFMTPLTIFTAVSSLVMFNRPDSETGLGQRAGFIAAALVAVYFCAQFGTRVTRVAYAYPDSNTGAAAIVANANTVIEDGDGLIIFPWTSWAFGFYGRWPVEFEETEASSNAFYVIPTRRNTLVVREVWNGVRLDKSQTAARDQLLPFLRGAPDRLYYAIDRGPPTANQWIVETLKSQGYRLRHREEHNQAMLMTFER